MLRYFDLSAPLAGRVRLPIVPRFLNWPVGPAPTQENVKNTHFLAFCFQNSPFWYILVNYFLLLIISHFID